MVSARRAGVVDGLHAHQHLGRDALVELDVALEGRPARSASAPRPRRSLARARRPPRPRRGRTPRSGDEALDARAPLALDQHLHRAVGQAKQLDDRAERADLEDVVRRRARWSSPSSARRGRSPCRALIASSSALIDFSRPTKSGTTMCGKTMMSRSGRSGTLRGAFFLSSSLLKNIVSNCRSADEQNRARHATSPTTRIRYR